MPDDLPETTVMTPQEFAQQMQEIARGPGRGDAETRHFEADDLVAKVLRTLGYGDGADIFDEMEKWYA